MKKLLLLLICFFAINIASNAQCINTFSYGSGAIVDSTLVSISSCNYLNEYSTVYGVTAGETYEFTVTNNGYITVYQDGVSTTLLGNGVSPLTVTSVTGGNMYAHWNVDAACATASGVCHTTTVQWTSWTPPTCPAPTAPVYQGIGTDTVAISWTTGGATEWIVEYGTAGFTQGTGITVQTTDNPYTFSGLTPGTTYNFYIRDYCAAGDSSAWIGAYAFSTNPIAPDTAMGITCTTSGAMPTVVFLEDFETGNAAGWTGDVGSGNGNWEIPDNATSSNTGADDGYLGGDFMNYEASNTVTNQGSIVSPAIDLSAGSDDAELSFWMHAYGVSMGTLEVGVGTSATGPFTTEFTWSGQYQSAGWQDWINVGVDLSSYVGQTIYIQFTQIDDNNSNGGSSGYDGDMSIDHIEVSTCVACAFPTNAMTSNMSEDTADIAWTTGGATQWDVQYGPTGFTLGSGTILNVSAAADTTLTGLMPATSYEWYVRDFCNPDSSGWVGPNSFMTTCSSIFSAPLCEDFEGASFVCWTNETTDQLDWTLNSGTTPSSPTGPNGSNGGSSYAYTETSGSSFGDSAILYSPNIDLSALVTPTIDFYYHMFGAAMDTDGTISVDISNDNGATWTNVFSEMGNHGNQWNNGYVELATYAGDTVMFRILGIVSTTGSTYYNDFAIDDFCVIEALPCPGAPSSLSVSNLMANSSDLHWVNNFSATDWVVEWDTAGFTQGTGTIVASTDTFTSISGLMGNTEYSFYVRDYCGGTDSSNWAGPFVFTTPCDIYTPYYIEDFTTFTYSTTPTCWEQYTNGSIASGPNGSGSSSWSPDGFANIGFTGAAKINIYGSFAMNDWIVSPSFDLSSGGYELVFDVAGTAYSSSVNPAAMGSDDTLALVMTEDGGMTWTIEQMWLQGSEPSLTGDRIGIHLTSVSPNAQFAFYGTNGSTSGGDNDLFIDNFIICTPVINTTAIVTDLCDGDTLALNTGMNVTSGGLFNDTLIATNGCDSIITYDVTLLMPTTNTENITICQGTPLTLPGGTVITTTGAYDEVFVNAVGCDSTVTFNVTMNVETSSTQDVHLCDGATFTLPITGTVVSTANSYVETTTNAAGCDSIITFIVTTGMSSTETINANICTGETYTLADGTDVTAGGTYTATNTNSSACDNVITYNITENMPTSSTVIATACNSYTWAIDGNTYTSTGMYTFTTTNAANCDSVITLDLTINMTTSSTDVITACDTYTWIDGNTYTMSNNTVTHTSTNSAGCTHTTTLDLTINTAQDETQNTSICQGESYMFGSQTLTSAGTYTETFTNDDGCEYDVVLTFTVGNTNSSNEAVLICGDQMEYTLANGTVVTEAGTYTAIVTGSNGCDEVITYDVTTCVSIFDIDNNIGINLYPNPTSDILNVEFSEKLSSTNNITVVNVLGQNVYTLSNTDNTFIQINTSNLTSGVYYLNVISDNKTSARTFTVSK